MYIQNPYRYVSGGADLSANRERWFKLDETSGTVADDAMENQDGTYTGGVTLGGTGTIGTSVSFDGVDNYIDFPSLENFGITDYPFTIKWWLKIPDFDDNKYIMETENSTNYQGLLLFLTTGNSLFVSFGDGSGTGSNSRKSYLWDGLFTVDTWYHCVLVVNSFTDLEFYLNGVDQGTHDSSSGTGAAMSFTASYRIGHSPRAAEFSTYELDDFATWSIALSASEISTNYAHEVLGIPMT